MRVLPVRQHNKTELISTYQFTHEKHTDLFSNLTKATLYHPKRLRGGNKFARAIFRIFSLFFLILNIDGFEYFFLHKLLWRYHYQENITFFTYVMFKGYLSCKIKWIQIANLKKVTLGMSSLRKKYDTYRAETWHAFRKVVCL